ncbi:MAG: NAD(P)-dependent oxidoreductase [Paenibacillus sp.]|nr:NAD(P)-dependent oxidoreductase [Paenibacillus sp.]
MTKIVVLGGNGMAGHVLCGWLSEQGDRITATGRNGAEGLYPLDLRDTERLRHLLATERPEVVINAAGLLNEAAEKRLQESIWVNSLLPHRLAEYGDELGFRLVHISTDCVFSGKTGSYTESSLPDGTSVYAKTKSLGEVVSPNHLTIRTSIIGPELKRDGIGLLHWFLMREGPVEGYSNVYWNGVTTLELAKFIGWSLGQPIGGLVHLAAERKVSKHELLLLMKEAFAKDIDVVSSAKQWNDKSLIGTREDCGYKVAPYEEMLRELAGWMKKRGDRYGHYPITFS